MRRRVARRRRRPLDERDLERAQDAVRIVRPDRCGTRGRERAQPLREHVRGMHARLPREPLAHLGVVRRRERHVAGERAHVEPGAAHDDRALPARMRAVDGGERVGDEARRRVPLVRIEKTHQMVRHARAFGVARRGGADRHAAIDLPRVRPDDLRTELLGERERELALAGCGLPGENQDSGRHTRLNSRAIAPASSRTIVGRPCGQCIGFSQRCSRCTSAVISG